jgi:hypothetical protein
MGEKEAVKITQNEQRVRMPKVRVTMAEIAEVKRQHILANFCYSPEEAGAIFGKSARWAIEKVREGKFVAVDDGVKPGENGLQPSSGIRITAISVEAFRTEYEIDPETWGE